MCAMLHDNKLTVIWWKVVRKEARTRRYTAHLTFWTAVKQYECSSHYILGLFPSFLFIALKIGRKRFLNVGRVCVCCTHARVKEKREREWERARERDEEKIVSKYKLWINTIYCARIAPIGPIHAASAAEMMGGKQLTTKQKENGWTKPQKLNNISNVL